MHRGSIGARRVQLRVKINAITLTHPGIPMYNGIRVQELQEMC